MAKSIVEQIQIILGVKSDGIWGPNSQEALNTEIGNTGASNPKLEKIQRLIGATADGRWGPQSQRKLNAVLKNGDGSGRSGGNGPFKAKASSFADPKDVEDFHKCKATGKTDKQCFAVGDNGIGAWGANTAQLTKPMVAIGESDAVARWGSWNGAAHRRVGVTVNGRTIMAVVEDKLGKGGRIDLNPAAAARLGLKPPFLLDCEWKWLV